MAGGTNIAATEGALKPATVPRPTLTGILLAPEMTALRVDHALGATVAVIAPIEPAMSLTPYVSVSKPNIGSSDCSQPVSKKLGGLTGRRIYEKLYMRRTLVGGRNKRQQVLDKTPVHMVACGMIQHVAWLFAARVPSVRTVIGGAGWIQRRWTSPRSKDKRTCKNSIAGSEDLVNGKGESPCTMFLWLPWVLSGL